MTPTVYLDDLRLYMARAEILEDRDHRAGKIKTVDDPLQQNVPIYNNVRRRYAGFSKVPEQMWRKDFAGKFEIDQWHYLWLVHRVTGSGASFEKDHGYRNSIVLDLAHAGYEASDFWEGCEKFLRDAYSKERKMFTSLGNQIPMFSRPSRDFPTGGIEYLIYDAPEIARHYSSEIGKLKKPIDVRTAVDFAIGIQSDMGMKKFHFVLTAWALDSAEYYPDLVDPTSLCYYGKNAYESFELFFDNTDRLPKKKFYDEVMRQLMREFPHLNPMDLEDSAGCDYIRYVENYVPKAYRHLPRVELQNNSLIENHPKIHPWFAGLLL